MVVNGSTVVHLNQTAAEYAYHFIQNTPVDAVVQEVSARYGIKSEQARQDFNSLTDKLRTIVEMPDLDPVYYLELDRDELYSGVVSAPYRLDCAITYRLPESGYDRYSPVDRVKYELPQTDWQLILKKAWEAGIPHVIFTGGEPTLRPDLPDLIDYAGKLGMVTGLITNGLRLAETDYLHQILQNGLDHLMLILDQREEASWEALRDTLAEDIAVVVHLTLTPQDDLSDPAIYERLAGMGVTAVSISASTPELNEKVPQTHQAAAEHGLKLIWDLPVPYSSQHPVALELAEQGDPIPQGAGKAWLYVEPDGDVLPGQGILEVLGNLLNDPWDAIWKNPPA
jgi:organic radical activating enzyme